MADAIHNQDTGPRRRSGWSRARDVISAPLRAAERRPVFVFCLIGALFAAGYLAGVLAFPSASGRIINGDAIQYYAYLRSTVFDGDVDFENDYRLLFGGAGPAERSWAREHTVTGRPPNVMSVGPAILWSPFYLGARAVLSVAGTGARDGLEPWMLASVGLAGVFYATLGACLTFWACTLFYPRRAAFWATLVMWLAGPAVYYSFVSPTYSHATSFFSVALFTFVWLRTRGSVAYVRMLLLGALGGLVTLVRWQDALVLLLPAVEMAVLAACCQLRILKALTLLAVMGLAAGVAFIPQAVAWNAIYGSPLLTPQGAGFMRWTSPAILSVLFSLRHGLFSWSPALLVGVAGWWLLAKRDRLTAWSVILLMAVTLYVNAAVADWWAGEAFGARRFVSDGVFFALGLSAVAARWDRTGRSMAVPWAATAAIVYNLLFLFQYQLFMRGMRDLVPYPHTVSQVFFDRLVLPFTLLVRWLS
jgi:hypothetical protein